MSYKGKLIKARFQSFKENKLVEYTFDRVPLNSIFQLTDLEYDEQIALMHICRKYKYDLYDERYDFKLNGSSLARLCNNYSNSNTKKFNGYINKFKKLQYIIETNTFYEIDFNYINKKAKEFKDSEILIKSINDDNKLVNNKTKLNKKNKNTSTDTDNFKQDNLSQESNISTSIETKVSQIEEKQPLNENQDITLKQEENIQDITLNNSTEEINNKITSTDIENLKQEELSQESNISTQEKVNVAVIEEKEPIIKERFQDFVNEFIESEEYDKISTQFNKLLLDVKYNYPTSMIKKVYYEVKNRFVNSNEKLERLIKIVDVIMTYFKLEEYFNDNNFVENSIDYILKDNYTENGLIRYNQNHYTENKTAEPVNNIQTIEVNSITEPELPLKIKETDDDNELLPYIDSSVSKSLIDNFNRFTTISLIELYLMYIDSYKEQKNEYEKIIMFQNNKGYNSTMIKQLFELTYNIIIDYYANPNKYAINIDEIINSYECT